MDECGGKRRILWLHGWATSAAVWRPAVEQLPEYEHTFISYQNCREKEDFLQTVHRRLNEQEEPLTVVGWSLGGMLLLDYLLEHPTDQTIVRTVLVASTLRFVAEEREKGWPPVVLQRMKRQLLSGAQETVLTAFSTRLAAPKSLADLSVNPLHASDFSERALLAGLDYLQAFDVRQKWRDYVATRGGSLSDIVWIHGDSDEVCPVGAVPLDDLQTQLKLVKGGGHWPLSDGVQTLVDVIRK